MKDAKKYWSIAHCVTLCGLIKISMFILKYNWRHMVMLFVVTKMACGDQGKEEQADTLPLDTGESQTLFPIPLKSPGVAIKNSRA